MSFSQSTTDRNFFPINICLKGRHVLFVGGGRETFKVAHRMLEFGPYLDILSERPIREVLDLSSTHSHRVRIFKKSIDYLHSDKVKISDYVMAFAYSKHEKVNAVLIEDCLENGVLCSTKHPPTDFIIPEIKRRGHLKLAVSTDGISPALDQVLISYIESEVMKDLDKYSLFLDTMAEMIDQLPTALTESHRAKMLDSVKELAHASDIVGALRRNSFSEASQLFASHLSEMLAQSKVDCSTKEFSQ